ncbi:mechanosensitive ion channel family protein [Enhydrobacter aerosaccus]|nr:mechanosensitive ion channel domain-containing protein [Enhydrobacter aerosaccus]
MAAATCVVVPATAAWAQAAKIFGTGSTTFGTFLTTLSERLDHTVTHIPKLVRYLVALPQQFDLATVLLLAAIVIGGLTAEYLTRQALQRMRHGIFARHGGESPLRAFLHAALLDGLALLALMVVGRFVVGQVGDPDSIPGKVAHQVLIALLYWRGFNFIFRAWLHPTAPEGRIAPVDDATAQRLLVGLNFVILIPLVARHIVMFMAVTQAGSNVISTAIIFTVPFFGACQVYVIWRWRRDMAAWLSGMVSKTDLFRALKLAMAEEWWIGGIAFYTVTALSAIYAAITERADAMRGLAVVESMLILLLLLETLVHRRTRHLTTEVPTVGEVLASCLRLAVRLLALVVAIPAILIDALGIMTPEEWAPHQNAMKLAALSTLAAFVLWRIVKYRMDRYIADNPLPAAGFDAQAEEDQPASASRLRTIMPVLRMTAGITILVLATLLVMSELGINITPLIAGASVLGLAVSFGSQSLVRDIVSGVFFLAEDSFRVGEYIDATKVKGTVEGFSIRSIRLRHQNGQLHIVPFGQLTHITNFSRDWTTVKFNLAFALETDVELLRKTVKKIGLDMMNEPAFAKELLQPLKMQGIVDIKDASLIVRFKFTARPNNPSLIQRTAIRRLFESLPKLGIAFAKPPYAMMGFGGFDAAARAQAAQ